MRDLLAPLVGHRHRYAATAVRLGGDEAGRLTLLLADVTWTGGAWCGDHLWLPCGPEWSSVRGRLGARVAFWATARPYRRKDGSRDYTLAEIGDVRVLGDRRAG